MQPVLIPPQGGNLHLKRQRLQLKSEGTGRFQYSVRKEKKFQCIP